MAPVTRSHGRKITAAAQAVIDAWTELQTCAADFPRTAEQAEASFEGLRRCMEAVEGLSPYLDEHLYLLWVGALKRMYDNIRLMYPESV